MIGCNLHNMRDVLNDTTSRFANRVALQYGDDNQMTYEQLQEMVVSMSWRLQAADITQESRVVLMFNNEPALVVAFMSITCLQATIIPVETGITSRELKQVCEDTQPDAIVGGRGQLDRVSQIMPPSIRRIDIEHELNDRGSTRSLLPAKPSSYVYQYTSGSTGTPKVAVHTQNNLINGGRIYQHTFEVDSHDVILTAVPLTHSFGMVAGLMTALLSGARLVLLERFVPNGLISLVESAAVTILVAVPFVYDLVSRCHLPNPPNLDSLRLCLSSGAPLTKEIAERFKGKYALDIRQAYGTTETGAIALQTSEDYLGFSDTVGKPVMGAQVRIVDTDKRDVEPGQRGQLLVHTSTVFKGYLNRVNATSKVLVDGWYHTGDIAYQDQDGFIYLIGRKETFINVGGKKVNPLETEQVMTSHPDVEEALVYSRNESGAGQSVHAKVVVQNKISESELIAFCRQHLTPYKVPVRVHVVDQIQKRNMGKVRRTSR